MTVSEPKQARSQQTLNRIINACEELLKEGTFEEISMQAIAEHAGVSVGNLYNRFASKEALIRFLIERMQAQQAEFVTTRLQSDPHATMDLEARLDFLAQTVDRAVAENTGLLQAIAARNLARSNPQTLASNRQTADFVRSLGDWLYGSGAELRRPDAKEACRFAVASIAFGLQYPLIFDTPVRLFGKRNYQRRLVEMALAYLNQPAQE